MLAFLRALRSCGERAHVIARTSEDLIFRTSFRVDVRWTRPNHALDMSVFQEAVARVRDTAGNRTLVVLPSTEYFNEFLLRNRQVIEELGCEIPLVDRERYGTLTGKHTATALFAAAGIDVPREASIAQPPVVAKPLTNVTPEGSSRYPHLLVTDAQVAFFKASENTGEYFFQEFMQGESLYLLFYLPHDGTPAFKWSQRNLLQQPGGKSMLLAEPAGFHNSGSAARMLGALRHIGFWGLGMIEVIRTSDRRDVFIEMNPRIWGPMQFCLDQHQPLVHAFIGDILCGDSTRFLENCSTLPRRPRYFWLGGLARTLASGSHATWHCKRGSSFGAMAGAWRSDIYLRSDSWRCFFHELAQALNLAKHSERTER